MKSYMRKIATSPLGVKLRNLTGWRSVPISFAHLQKNASVSDGFIWRVDEHFTTKFNFADLLPLFTNSTDNTIILEFFDHLHQPIKAILTTSILILHQTGMEVEAALVIILFKLSSMQLVMVLV